MERACSDQGLLTFPLQVAPAPLQMPQQPVWAGVEEEGLLLVDRLWLLRPLDTDSPGLRPVTIPDAQLGVKHHELLAVQGKLGHRHRDIVRAQLAAQQALHGEGAWGAHTRMSGPGSRVPPSPPPSDPEYRLPAQEVPVSPSPKAWSASRKSVSWFLRSMVSFSQYQDTWLSQTHAP